MQVKIEEKEHVEKKLRKKLRTCLEKLKKKTQVQNIARGTTDPGY